MSLSARTCTVDSTTGKTTKQHARDGIRASHRWLAYTYAQHQIGGAVVVLQLGFYWQEEPPLMETSERQAHVYFERDERGHRVGSTATFPPPTRHLLVLLWYLPMREKVG